MSEIKLFGEQPKPDAATSATNVEIDKLSPDSPDGSPIGKFKDANALLSAYNSLQAEFTKKCQKLADYEKKQDNMEIPCFKRENWQDTVEKWERKLHVHCPTTKLWLLVKARCMRHTTKF